MRAVPRSSGAGRVHVTGSAWLQRARWNVGTRASPLEFDDDSGGACNPGDGHRRSPEDPCRFNLVGALSVGLASLLAVHIGNRLASCWHFAANLHNVWREKALTSPATPMGGRFISVMFLW